MATYDGKAPPDLRYFDELGFAMGKRLPASADSDDALVASLRQIGLSVAFHGFVMPMGEPIDYLGHHIAFDVKGTLDAQKAADAFLAKHLK